MWIAMGGICGTQARWRTTKVAACKALQGCRAWTWDWKRIGFCYLKSGCKNPRPAADRIFSSHGVQVLWQGHVNGAPSDHSLLKAVLGLPRSVSSVTEPTADQLDASTQEDSKPGQLVFV